LTVLRVKTIFISKSFLNPNQVVTAFIKVHLWLQFDLRIKL